MLLALRGGLPRPLRSWLAVSAVCASRCVLVRWGPALPFTQLCASFATTIKPDGPPAGKWSKEESDLLREVVTTLRTRNPDPWSAVAELVPGRSSTACRTHWFEVVNPKIATGPWTEKEDAALTKLVAKKGEGEWFAISAAMKGRRSPTQCSTRWRKYVLPSVGTVLRTGRWSKEENELLREAVAQFGTDDWSAVAKQIPGRSSTACRTHWVDYLNPSIVTGPWSAIEDAALTKLFAKKGDGEWFAISAAMLGRRSPTQCSIRWRKFLQSSMHTGLRLGKWSNEENELLKEAIARIGTNWSAVAKLVPGRSPSACRTHWVDYLNPSIVIGPWTEQEDALLTQLVAEKGEAQWVAISAAMNGQRSPMQCSLRWRRDLVPTVGTALRAEKWSDKENGLLREAVARIGTDDWSVVAELVPGRSSTVCRGHWMNCLNPNIATGCWTAEEDAVLTQLVAEKGEGEWVEISAGMAGRRSPTQCSNRWRRYLLPSIGTELRTGKWSNEENELLREAVSRIGAEDWGTVALLVPGRSSTACRRHWVDCLNQSSVSGPWSAEEDSKLTQLVAEKGEGEWSAISVGMAGRRSPKQCWIRWRRCLQPGFRASMRTGKWSNKENELLREAVARIGTEDWGAVAKQVPGRNWNACRTHWVDYLNPSIVIGPWTEQEDALLTQLVAEKGEAQWVAISTSMNGRRSPKQCWYRWREYLQSGMRTALRTGRWSKEENQSLKEAVARIGTDDWVAVADLVPGRSSDACRSHWLTYLHPSVVTGCWTAEEDAVLTQLVAEKGEGEWVEISAGMAGRRSPTQCSNRWRRYLLPSIGTELRTGKWSNEENELLRETVSRIGAEDWSAVAKQVPGRHSSACRDHWLTYLHPSIIKGPWTEEEDITLTKLVAEKGAGEWVAISAAMNGRRSRHQCRDRWVYYLQPDISTNPFTEEEDTAILTMFARIGGRWTPIAKSLPGRTALSVRDRCRYLLKHVDATQAAACGLPVAVRVDARSGTIDDKH